MNNLYQLCDDELWKKLSDKKGGVYKIIAVKDGKIVPQHRFLGIDTDGILYIQVFTFLAVFILSKYLIEKIISTTFQIEEFTEQFNLFKVSYRTYFGFILLPVNMILYYNSVENQWIYITLAVILFVLNLLT